MVVELVCAVGWITFAVWDCVFVYSRGFGVDRSNDCRSGIGGFDSGIGAIERTNSGVLHLVRCSTGKGIGNDAGGWMGRVEFMAPAMEISGDRLSLRTSGIGMVGLCS